MPGGRSPASTLEVRLSKKRKARGIEEDLKRSYRENSIPKTNKCYNGEEKLRESEGASCQESIKVGGKSTYERAVSSLAF